MSNITELSTQVKISASTTLPITFINNVICEQKYVIKAAKVCNMFYCNVTKQHCSKQNSRVDKQNSLQK